MKILSKRLVIFVGACNGKTHQVELSDDERNRIINVLLTLHDGKIKVFKEDFDSIEWKKAI